MDDQRSGKRSREEEDDEQANADRNKRQKTSSDGSYQRTEINEIARLGEPQITRPSVSILVIAPKQVLDAIDPLLLGEFKHKKPSPEATLYWESRVERHWCVAVASDTAPLSTIYDLCSSAREIVMFVERQQDVPITYVQKLNHRGSTTEFEDKSYMFPLQNEIHLDQLPNDARRLMMTMVDRKKKYGANVLLGLYLVAQNCEENAIVDAAYEWILAPRVNVKYALCFCARFNSLDVDPSEAAQIFQNQGAEDGLGVQSVVPGRGSTIVFFTAPPSLLWLIRLASFEYFVEKFRKHGLILTSLAPATKHHLAQVIVKNRDEPFRDRLFDLYCQLELEEKIIANTVTEDRQAALKRQNAAARVRRILGSRLEFYPRAARRVQRMDSVMNVQTNVDTPVVHKPHITVDMEQTPKSESTNTLSGVLPLQVSASNTVERRSRNLLLVLPSAESSSLFSLLNGTVMTINPDFSVIRYEADESLYSFSQPEVIDMVFICQNKDNQALTRLAKGADMTVIIKCADSAEYVSLVQVEGMSLQKEAPFGFALQSSTANLSETDLNIARMFRGALSAFWITPRHSTMEGIIESALYTLIHSLPHVKHRPAFMAFTFNVPVQTEDDAHAIVDQQFKALNLPCWFKVINFIKERVVISTTSWLVSLFVEQTTARLQDEGLMSVPQSVLADGRKYLLSAVLPTDEANISEALDNKAGEKTTNSNPLEE